MSTTYRVALLGFSRFEHSTLASCFRLASRREPTYVLVDELAQAQFAVADADNPPAVQQVTLAGRVDDTVFIGSRPPPGATAWMLRPIDPVHVMRELDAMVALAHTAGAAPAVTPDVGAPARPPDLPHQPHQLHQPVRPRDPAEVAFPPSEPWLPTPLPGQRPVAARPPVAPPRPSIAPERPAPAVAGSPSGPPQALLVDDSELALRYLASRLQRWGLQCVLAQDSARALELMAQRAFDLVFIDVELGPASPLDGLELCRHLRRQHPPHGDASPLLALVSAHHSELDRARGTLAGADAYLGKPLQGQELARLLRRQGLRPPPAEAGAALPSAPPAASR